MMIFDPYVMCLNIHQSRINFFNRIYKATVAEATVRHGRVTGADW